MIDQHLEGAHSRGRPPALSVVIPAFNEAAVIEGCLASLGSAETPVEVVVAANGCTDRTVGLARTFTELENLVVLDIPTPSKPEALNAGDRHCSVFPRVYLDADARVSPKALLLFVEALKGPHPRLATARVHIDSRRSTWLVRAFFRVFVRLPFMMQGATGGAYALSRSGRERFASFPSITADDLFVQRLFSPHEHVVIDADVFTVAPRNVSALIQVRTRVARGTRELQERSAATQSVGSDTTGATLRALVRLTLRRPWSAFDVAVYCLISAVARARARSTGDRWERDGTTR